MKLIDARKLSCPAPVIETKNFLDSNSECKQICVLVDNQPAFENVSRFLSNYGFEVEVSMEKETYKLIGTSQGREVKPLSLVESEFSNIKTLIMISKDELGSGDSILGKSLMKNFIATLNEYQGLWMLVFVNGGVKLTINDSLVLSDLKNLEKSGIKILVCGTCLGHYNLLESKEIGETTNMLDIVTSLNLADKVISI
ncbi:MAG: sulfurtransferase-like selenium metabolism protein YedF [Desulforegulaceae bacterium]|nr:sulfurtransferase-like selenium metabolism protein YedF [Desulforegulaceae bacterium]